jgi:actin-related protein
VTGAGPGGEVLGVHTLVSQAINQCDADLRGTLLASTVVTGGSTLTGGFVERLNNEMAATVSSVRASHTHTCNCAHTNALVFARAQTRAWTRAPPSRV